MVSNTLHPSADPACQGVGEHNGTVPLVCRPLHSHLLLSHTAVHLQSLAGWLAGSGGSARSHRGVHHFRHRGEYAAVTSATVAAVIPALLGLPAPLDALLGTLGPQSQLDAGPLLLLLQVLQTAEPRRHASLRASKGRSRSGDVWPRDEWQG